MAPVEQKPKRVERDWNAIRIAVTSGALTMEVVSEKLGIPLGTILSRSSREKWYQRGEKPADFQSKVPVVPDAAVKVLRSSDAEKLAVANELQYLAAAKMKDGELIAQTVSEELKENRDSWRGSIGRVMKRQGKHLETLPDDQILAKAGNIAQLTNAAKNTFGSEDEQPAALVLSLGLIDDEKPIFDV